MEAAGGSLLGCPGRRCPWQQPCCGLPWPRRSAQTTWQPYSEGPCLSCSGPAGDETRTWRSRRGQARGENKIEATEGLGVDWEGVRRAERERWRRERENHQVETSIRNPFQILSIT